MPAGKQTAYEEDIHLPLIVRGPNVAAGRRVSQITGNIDLAPTMAAMGGVKPGDFVDGRSFLPLVTGQAPTTWRQAYLVEHWTPGPEDPAAINQEPGDIDQEPTDIPPTATATAAPTPTASAGKRALSKLTIPEFHGIRVDGYTYVEYVTGEKELYDLTKDPYQLNNLASKADPALLKEFSDRVAALVKCKADSCRAAEDQPFTVKAP
jgi:arylsulfatase A-like enzyme